MNGVQNVCRRNGSGSRDYEEVVEGLEGRGGGGGGGGGSIVLNMLFCQTDPIEML